MEINTPEVKNHNKMICESVKIIEDFVERYGDDKMITKPNQNVITDEFKQCVELLKNELCESRIEHLSRLNPLELSNYFYKHLENVYEIEYLDLTDNIIYNYPRVYLISDRFTESEIMRILTFFEGCSFKILKDSNDNIRLEFNITTWEKELWED